MKNVKKIIGMISLIMLSIVIFATNVEATTIGTSYCINNSESTKKNPKVHSNDEIIISLSLDNEDEKVMAVFGALEYDKDVLELLEFSDNNTSTNLEVGTGWSIGYISLNGNENEKEENADKPTFLIYSNDEERSNTIGYIKFKVKDPVKVKNTEIKLKDITTYDIDHREISKKVEDTSLKVKISKFNIKNKSDKYMLILTIVIILIIVIAVTVVFVRSKKIKENNKENVEKIANNETENTENEDNNKKINKRILGILYVDLCNPDSKDYIMKLKQKVNYFTKNKQATIFDYEKFKYHYNTSFFKYLITSNVDISIYHNYVISNEFINYIEEEINKYELDNYKDTFPYLEEQKNRIKYILNYALNYKQNNEYKLLYNSLIHKLNTVNSTNQFYNEEYVNRNKIIDVVRRKGYSKEEINYDLKNEYEILRIYGLNEQEFNLNVPKINKHTYIKWLRNMIYLDINFLNNDILRNRTLYILNQIITSDKTLEREKQKIKNKILKINKELEY